MGHVRLGSLPRSRKWQQVVGLLDDDADVRRIAAASSEAAEAALAKAASEPSFAEAFWLLTQIPLAARSDDFADALRGLGLKVSDGPTLIEVVGAFGDAIERQASEKGAGRQNDFGEIARLSAVEALGAVAGRDLPGLFGPSPEDVRHAIGKLTSPKNFTVLAREFFSRLTRRTLDYYLSRELSNHVGGDGRFRTLADQSDFDTALDSHCREASRIVKEFAGSWYSKSIYEETLTPDAAERFAHVAFKKVRKELRKRRDADA